jgi:hypothetical protein
VAAQEWDVALVTLATRKPPPVKRGDDYFVDGTPYPAVTSVLREVAKDALVGWAAKETALYVFEHPGSSLSEATAARYKTSGRAADKGKLVHSWAEAVLQGAELDPLDLPTEAQPHAQALLSYLADNRPELLHAELILVNETQGYAGTADALVRTLSGTISIDDWKTSKSVWEYEHSLQLSAYKHAEYGLDPRTRERIELPVIDKARVIHLPASGKYAVHEMPDRFQTFRAYLHAYRARAGKPCPPACWCQLSGSVLTGEGSTGPGSISAGTDRLVESVSPNGPRRDSEAPDA